MIPRFKPHLGAAELRAVLAPSKSAIVRFEQDFAHAFGARHGVVFPYGRSALWAFFNAMGLSDTEVVMPAYQCVVVAHAIVLSGNVPRFVDVRPDDYNMEPSDVARAIGPRTGAIVATHFFGYPMDVERLDSIVREGEARYGRKIWIIQDCAHAFGATWKGRLVAGEGDLAFFGLGVTKLMTSVFGGMVTTNDGVLAERLRDWRDRHFRRAPWRRRVWRRLYLAAAVAAFNDRLFGAVNWLERHTAVLDRFTKAYHLDDEIHFPPDYLEQISDAEASVGLAQLARYREIVQRRIEHAVYYDRHLRDVPGIVLPPLMEGATYSHYVPRVQQRRAVMKALRRRGIDLGELVPYAISELPRYEGFKGRDEFPHAVELSRSTINLPVYAELTDRQRAYVVQSLRQALAEIHPADVRIRPLE